MSKLYPITRGLAVREAYMEAINDPEVTHVIVYSDEYSVSELKMVHLELRKQHFKLFNNIGNKEVWKHLTRCHEYSFTKPVTIPDCWRERFLYLQKEERT